MVKGGVVKDNLLYNVNIPSGGKVAASLQTAEIVTLSYCLYNMYIPSKIHAQRSVSCLPLQTGCATCI